MPSKTYRIKEIRQLLGTPHNLEVVGLLTRKEYFGDSKIMFHHQLTTLVCLSGVADGGHKPVLPKTAMSYWKRYILSFVFCAMQIWMYLLRSWKELHEHIQTLKVTENLLKGKKNICDFYFKIYNRYMSIDVIISLRYRTFHVLPRVSLPCPMSMLHNFQNSTVFSTYVD